MQGTCIHFYNNFRATILVKKVNYQVAKNVKVLPCSANIN